jgi:glucose-6-phosphate 1-dehydrogenase
LEAAGLLHCPIIGVAKDNWSHQQLLAAGAAAVRKSGDEPKTAVMTALARRLTYLQGDFTDPATYTARTANRPAHRGRTSIWRSPLRCSVP